MLRAQGGGDRFGKSMWPARSRKGSRRGLSFTHDGVGFHPNGRWRYTSYSILYGYGGVEWSYLPHTFPRQHTTVMSFLQEHWRATGINRQQQLQRQPRNDDVIAHTPPIQHWIST